MRPSEQQRRKHPPVVPAAADAANSSAGGIAEAGEETLPVTPIVKAVHHLETGDWQAAHALVQKDATSLGCWAHGLVHLIEGDLENAKYWYRRAHRPLPHGNTATAEIAALKAMVKSGTQ